MSSIMEQAMEERHERQQAEAIAAALGISTQDLAELNYSIQEHTSDDGTPYGLNIYFSDDCDPEILKQIGGLTDGRWVRIGPI
jgi:hypothetical protein